MLSSGGSQTDDSRIQNANEVLQDMTSQMELSLRSVITLSIFCVSRSYRFPSFSSLPEDVPMLEKDSVVESKKSAKGKGRQK